MQIGVENSILHQTQALRYHKVPEHPQAVRHQAQVKHSIVMPKIHRRQTGEVANGGLTMSMGVAGIAELWMPTFPRVAMGSGVKHNVQAWNANCDRMPYPTCCPSEESNESRVGCSFKDAPSHRATGSLLLSYMYVDEFHRIDRFFCEDENVTGQVKLSTVPVYDSAVGRSR